MSAKIWETFRQTKDGKELSDKLELIEASINDVIANGIDIDDVHYAHKQFRHETVFPEHRKKVFEMGAALAR